MIMQQLLYKDFTIKAKCDNLEDVTSRLKALNATFQGIDEQHDTYFKTEPGNLKWRQGTIENLITHYERVKGTGVERTIVYRYDLNPSKEQIDQLYRDHEILGTVRKQRAIYWLENVKIHVDRLKDDRCFIELEAMDKHNAYSEEQLRSQCLSVKEKLNIHDVDLVGTGYLV
jgi:adenylate cyclase, class 2